MSAYWLVKYWIEGENYKLLWVNKIFLLFYILLMQWAVLNFNDGLIEINCYMLHQSFCIKSYDSNVKATPCMYKTHIAIRLNKTLSNDIIVGWAFTTLLTLSPDSQPSFKCHAATIVYYFTYVMPRGQLWPSSQR